MNPEPTPPDRASAPTIAELQREAHFLINQIGDRPGAAKLLLGTLQQLRMFADYKRGRSAQLKQRLKKGR